MKVNHETSDDGLAAPTEHRRRIPQQERARRRVEAILAAARALIVESGSDALKMSDLAERAGVPIGSVYQYFPDKPAILRELVLRLMARVHNQLVESMASVTSKADALERVDTLLDGFYTLIVTESDTRDIWAAAQADKELQRLDLEDSQANATVIAAALRHLVTVDNWQRLEDVSLLLTHLAGGAARLALAVGPEVGQRLMAEFRTAVHRHVNDLLTEG